MGGGKGGGSNSSQIDFQKQQAEESRQKEISRQARLSSGSAAINQLFDGTPVGAKTLDLSSLTNANAAWPDAPFGSDTAGAPLLNKVVSLAARDQPGRHNLADGYYADATPKGGSGYAVYDSSGGQVAAADSWDNLAKQKITYGGDPTQRAGGFGSEFYDKFKQANLDYYQPELARQYATANSGLNYSLARAGQLQSSTAGDKLADLVYEHDVNNAQISSKADAATAGLRDTVSANKQAAINQLYSTEDPSLAANTATGMVRNVELTQPSFSPIGELFKPIAIGVGSGLTGYNNAKNYSQPGANSGTTGVGKVIS